MDTVGTTKTVGQKLSIKNMHHETADITVERYFKSMRFLQKSSWTGLKCLKETPSISESIIPAKGYIF